MLWDFFIPRLGLDLFALMSKGKRVFVTGSTGCIGTHAVELIMEEGAEVFGFNRSAPLDLSGNPLYHYIKGDLSDQQSLKAALEEARPTHVLHLGALQTPDCRDYPMRGMEVNLMGTALLFKACSDMQLPLERFVFASSSAVNGLVPYKARRVSAPKTSSAIQSLRLLEDRRGGYGKLFSRQLRCLPYPCVWQRPMVRAGS